MDLATATNNLLPVTNNTSNHNHHHNHHHQQRGLSEGQFEKHESAIETNVKPLTFTNGVLKRHGNVATVTGSNAAAATRQLIDVANSTIYKECLKNHAASLGGHALDGCGEFMPSPNSSPANPTSLKCAACGCHRNFHRRDPDDPCPLVIQPPTTITQVIEYQPHHRHHPPAPVTTSPSPASFRQHSPSPPSPPPISSSYYPSSAPHMLLALSSGGVQNPPPVTTTPPVQNPAENSQNVSVFATPVSNNTTQMMTATANGRKRFRTKFTSGQKEKMLDFAERVGWKMQKRDDEIVASFCKEIGVERGVLKVWMHNNKSKSGESHQINNQQLRQQQHVNNVVATNGNLVRNNVVDINALNMNHSVMHNSNHHSGGVGSGHHVRGSNGNNHDDGDDEDESEDDDDDSPHHGALGSSSTS